MKQLAARNGFTLVEVIVTLFVVSVFLAIVLQTLYVSSIRQVQATDQMTALTIAQSNLNKFPTAASAIKESPRYLDANGNSHQRPPFYCKPGTNFISIAATPEGFNEQPDTNTLLNPTANGIRLLDSTAVDLKENIEATPESLINPVQKVVIYTPHGCTTDTELASSQAQNINAKILRIVSTVTYGLPEKRANVEVARYVML